MRGGVDGNVGYVDGPVLGIETSGGLAGAALVLKGRLAGEASIDLRASSQEMLLEQVRGLLAAYELHPVRLRRIGASLGPGSFTGLRVGLAAARGLALGAGVPVVGIPSHQALAWPWRGLGRRIVLLTGMRRGQVFLELGRWSGLDWQAEVEADSVAVEGVESRLRTVAASGRLLFLGEAVESMLEVCPGLQDLGDPIRDPLAVARRPASVALLAAREGAVEWRGRDLERLLPLYLRGADAVRPRVPR